MIINIIDFDLFLTQYLIIRTERTVSSFPKGYHGQSSAYYKRSIRHESYKMGRYGFSSYHFINIEKL